MSARDQLLKIVQERLQRFDERALRRILAVVEDLEASADEDPLLAMAGMLDGAAISSEEIDELLYGPVKLP